MMGPIEQVLLEISDSDFYGFRKMTNLTAEEIIMLYFIVGERRIGKTLLFQRLACELFKRFGWQTMWVRNKQVELVEDGFRSSYLNAPKRLGWCPDDWTTRTDGVWTNDGKKETVERLGEPEQVILFQSISTFSNRRGNETPRVMCIIFDEFMPEDRKYPKNCCKGLMSLTKTVLSGREDARCFCLSNFISAANPYFVGFRIYPDEHKDITVFGDKGIAIEVCRGYKRAIEKDNPWNLVYSAGNYQDYATQNEDSLMQLVGKVPKGAEPMDYIILNEGLLYRGFMKNGLVYFQEFRGRVNNEAVYTPNLQEVGQGIFMMPDFMKAEIRTMTACNAIRFRNPNVMFAILSTVYETV